MPGSCGSQGLIGHIQAGHISVFTQEGCRSAGAATQVQDRGICRQMQSFNITGDQMFPGSKPPVLHLDIGQLFVGFGLHNVSDQAGSLTPHPFPFRLAKDAMNSSYTSIISLVPL